MAEFEHEGVRLIGSSLAGEETWFIAPEMNLGFDFGRAPREVLSVDHIFLSHGHMDHAAGVAYYFSQRMFIDNEPGTLYAPAGLIEPVRQLLDLWGGIDGNVPPAHLVPLEAGVDVPLRRDLVVRPFEVEHFCRGRDRVVIKGFGFTAIEVRQKLKPEYHGLSGPEIVEVKKQGKQITDRVEIPLVAYCGDTAPGGFLELDYVKNAKVLLLECTFVDPEHVERARAGCHIHISDLREILPRLNNERILLTHLSRRTGLAEARAYLEKELGREITDRVSFFMEHGRRRGRGRRRGGKE